jgi:hypothetical protein
MTATVRDERRKPASIAWGLVCIVSALASSSLRWAQGAAVRTPTLIVTSEQD